jgi:hypothetical protein
MPNLRRIQAIMALTDKDLSDHLYWRATVYEGWRRLRTQEDYGRLNAAVDRLSQ